jgi:hypothetical protein
LLLTLAMFGAFWLVGLAVLAVVRADLEEPRFALSAPVVGACTIALVLFSLSRFGFAIEDVAVVVAAVLVAGSGAVLKLRRPAVSRSVWLVLAICAVAIPFLATPQFEDGWRWIARSNGDMATYLGTALRLLHHGFWDGVDGPGLASGRNYATVYFVLDASGQRPTTPLLLAWARTLSGREGHEIYMPVALAIQLVLICSTGALAASATRRAPGIAAGLAAGLLLITPMTTFGFVQQLAPQAWGLAVLASLSAVALRRELWRGYGPTWPDVAVSGLLLGSLLLVYPEVLPVFVAASGLFVVLLLARRQLDVGVAIRGFAPALLLALLLVNTYFPRVVDTLRTQTNQGTHATDAVAPIFAFMFTPPALPGTLGFVSLPTSQSGIGFEIVIALIVLAALVVGAAWAAWRGIAAGPALLVMFGLAAFLAAGSNDFGLFKLSMFGQPFAVALLAAGLAALLVTRPRWSIGPAALLVAFAVVAFPVARAYVDSSRHPVDAPHASDPDQLPAFKTELRRAAGAPIVSATEVFPTDKLQAFMADGKPIFFLVGDPYSSFITSRSKYVKDLSGSALRQLRAARRTPLSRPFHFDLSAGRRALFTSSSALNAALRAPRCRLVIPGGSVTVINRAPFGTRSPAVIGRPCQEPPNVLAFVDSSLSQQYYNTQDARFGSLRQLEADPLRPGDTFAGSGRYVFVRALNARPGARLLVDLTATVMPGGRQLPPAKVFGARGAVALPLVGRGSARVLSPPVEPRRIDGGDYFMLDLGRPAAPRPSKRTGLEGLYGGGALVDPRFLVAYIRNVSLVDGVPGRVPSVLTFPQGPSDPNVIYSGLYEDGWVGDRAYAELTAPARAHVVVKGETFADAFPPSGLPVRLLVDGRPAARGTVRAGAFTVDAPVSVAPGRHRIDLLVDAPPKPLPNGDGRPVVALLKSFGFRAG